MSIDNRVQTLFAELIELSPAERGSRLDAACAGDSHLRAQILSLLASHDNAGTFMAAPTADFNPHTPSSVSPHPMPGSVVSIEGTGSRIGAYKLLQLIGEGGFGAVFMAEQERPVVRKVALKIIKLGMDTQQVVARFEQERQALAILDHPNIAKVFDAGATELGRPYFVMELCTGEAIDEYCDRHNLTIDERLSIFEQVCQAVQHAHTKGIIHRDIKPSNVLVSTLDGRPMAKIIDFGIAKATASRLTEKTLFTEHKQIIGTPEYMSPEQAEGSLDIDTRTDVYALGVLLYELLTGSTPFTSAELRSAAYAEIQRIIREVDPPRPSARLSQRADTLASVAARRKTEPRTLGTIVRGELDWIVMKALEKDRARRYESANSLAMDVRRYLSGEAIVAAPPSKTYAARKFVLRHRLPVLAGVAVGVSLLVGAVAFAWQAQVAREQRDIAIAAQQAEKERAEGERAANEQARKRLVQVEKANGLLASVFKGLDPREIALAERPLQAMLVEKLDAAVAGLEGDAIGDPLVVAQMQLDLGSSLASLGEAGKAVALIEKARDVLEARLGPDHEDTLTAANELAMARFDAGDLQSAQSLMERTLAARKAQREPNEREIITCMNNLATIYTKIKRHADATPLLEDALTRRTRLDGPDHPETANAMHNLALAYAQAGDHAKATPLVESALRIRRATIGEAHPYTMLSQQLLATCYSELGNGEAALPILVDAVARSRSTLGPDHPTTISIAYALAKRYFQNDDLENTRRVFEEILPHMRSRLGADHTDTLSATTNLAALYWRSKQLDRSIPLFEDAVRSLDRTLGRDHETTQTAIANLGVNYASAGRTATALPLLEEVYASSRNMPALTFARQSLFDCYVATGNREKAGAILGDVIDYARSTLPNRSTRLAGALVTIADGLLKLKMFSEAESLLREALGIRERRQAEEWVTPNTRSMLGAALLGQSKLDEAEPLLLAGYQGLVERKHQIPAPANDRLLAALDRLIDFSTKAGKADDVSNWQRERAKIAAESQPGESGP